MGVRKEDAELIEADAKGIDRQGEPERLTRMGTGSIPKLIAEFAIPSIIGMVVNGSYNIVDSVFLGHALGEIGLSTMTVANPIMIVFMAMGMLIGNGGNALAALRLGEGKREEAERALGNVITLSIVLSVIIAILASIPPVMDFLLTASSATDEVRPYAYIFIQILSYGFFLQCISFGVNNFIRTSGSPNIALGTMVIGLVAATGFNFWFVILNGWGVVGSAFATLAGEGCSTIAVLGYFLFYKDVPMRIKASCLAPKAKTVATILIYGFPSFAMQTAMAVVNFVLNFQLSTFGAQSSLGADNALASIGVVSRLGMFTAMPLIGTATSIQPLLGYNYGALKIPRVRKTLGYGIGVVFVIGLVEWLVIMLFPQPIVQAFGIEDAMLESFTAFALQVQLFVLPVIGIQMTISIYFQATGQPAKSIFLTLTRQILFLIPLLLVMPHVLPVIVPQLTSLDALYFAAPISDAMAMILSGIFLIWELVRLRKLQAQMAEEA